MLGSILAFFAMLEATLRVIDYPRREAKILCLDAVMGNVYCPNIEERLDNMYDSKLLVKINGDGMADREYPRIKPANTIRIALLGDSVTASLYTPVESKFKSIWEKALTESAGKPVEILNFAVDGTGTWEQLQMLHLRARHFQPDFVILSFFWGNDVWNNSASLNRSRANPLKGEYDESSWSRNLQVKHRKTIRWLWNNSAAFQFLDTLKDRLGTILDYRQAMNSAKTAAPAASANPNTGVGAGAKAMEDPGSQYDPGFFWNSESWTLTRELIVKLNAETKDIGAHLLVFHLPFYDQLVMQKPLPYAEFRAFLRQSGIANADAFDPMTRLSIKQKRDLFISDRVHLTAEGHRFVAEAGLPAIKKFVLTPGLME
jgi:lysophospholipase L1-like esterase